MKKALLILFVLALVFLFGCAQEPEVEPVEKVEVVKEVVEEPETPESIIASIEGQPCNSSADCGEKIATGEPYCLGLSKYQKYFRPKCSFNNMQDKVFVCSFEETVTRIGSC